MINTGQQSHSARLRIEQLEERAMLAIIPFHLQPPILTSANGAKALVAEDFDMDGDTDIVAASVDRVVWYSNENGMGTFGAARVLDSGISYARSVRSADIDGDGDLDVLSLSSGTTSWYENTDGRGTFGPPQIIAGGPGGTFGGQWDLSPIDFDRDGDVDVLLTTVNEVFWFENTDGRGAFGSKQRLVERAAWASAVHAADIDMDGDLDVVSTGRIFAWSENLGGQKMGPQRIIENFSRFGRSNFVSTTDFDRDGDLDVFLVGDEIRAAWYVNTDGTGTFRVQQQLAELRFFFKSAFLADVDGDDDIDILATTARETMWFENTDGVGMFGPPRIIAAETGDFSAHDNLIQVRSVAARDMDGDGDLDVVETTHINKRLRWFENVDGQGNFAVEHLVDSALPVSQLSAAVPLDVDNDGDLDVVSASSLEGRVAWQENVDGFGNFGPRRAISRLAIGVGSLLVGDLNGDGWHDVITVGRDDNRVAWHENLGSGQGFAAEQFIADDTLMADSAIATDVDGDGDLDVAMASQIKNVVAWSENLGDGRFGSIRELDADAPGASEVSAADVDGDGDTDVVAASYGNGTIGWYENLDGIGTFSRLRPILRKTGARAVFPADMDGDGDVDLVAGGSTRAEGMHNRWFGWVENLRESDSFVLHELPIIPDPGRIAAMAADLDGDGRLDAIVSTEEVTWFANQGDGEFTAESSFGGYPNQTTLGDLDNDGDLDILMAQDSSITWFRSEAARSTNPFGEEMLIASSPLPLSMDAADIDGDGDLDVTVGSLDGIAWYANLDAAGSFQLQASFDAEGQYVVSLDAMDVDEDGDMDLLAVASASGISAISWYENVNGAGNFSAALEIGSMEAAASLHASDLDGDGDMDVAVTGGRTLWFENQINGGQGWRRHGIVDRYTEISSEQGNSVIAADLDGDAAPDLILATGKDIVWYERNLAQGDFQVQRVIQGDDVGATYLAVGDLDADGDADLIAGWYSQIVWYENQDGRGTFGPGQEVSFEVSFVTSVAVGDVDKDGDLDVLSASWGDDKIAWYENVNGRGLFGGQQVIAYADHPELVAFGDFDRDEDLDLVAALRDEASVVWYRNTPADLNSRLPGDVNDDRRFDQRDVHIVLRAGKYRTGKPAGWRDGDWNRDGVFDQVDLVFALQTGSYLE